jgi:hypothetical protein
MEREMSSLANEVDHRQRMAAHALAQRREEDAMRALEFAATQRLRALQASCVSCDHVARLV